MENNTIGFNLIGLKTEQFATFEENYSEKKETQIHTGIEFKLSSEQKRIGIFAEFTFTQETHTLVKLQISCHFAVSPESWDSFCSESKIVFPKGFMMHLTMLTIGTARGVLHAKTEGTIFNQFILPTINVEELISKDVEFDLT